MKKLIFLILISLIVQISCSKSQQESIRATKKCEVELKDLPAIRGLKIGMSFPLKAEDWEQVEYNFQHQTRPGTQTTKSKIENAQELGYRRRSFVPGALRNMLSDPQVANSIDTKNLDQIEVETFDNKLIEFRLNYDKSQKAPSTKEAVYRIADALNLSREAFDISDIAGHCSCKNFSIHIISGNTITFWVAQDMEETYKITDILIERDKIREEKKKNTFTP